MTLLEQIQGYDNHFFKGIRDMHANGLPLVLYGAGCLGQMTAEFMFRENLPLDKIALNRHYITEGMTFHGLPVVSIEDLIEQPGKFNCIVALQYVHDALQQELRRGGANVLVYDPAFIGVSTTLWYTQSFCDEHSDTLEAVYAGLADERSRETLVAFLKQRLSATRGYYQAVYEPAHYFPADIIRLQNNEVFIDCGAYNGDSIGAFMQEVVNQGVEMPEKIVGFEPDAGNFSQLCDNTRQWPFCQPVQKGVWENKTVLSFQSGNALSSRLVEQSSDTVTIELDSIDNILQGGKATFIKMDVEGAELKALQGAAGTIRAWHPLLAISLYHKPEDLLTIPQYIQSLSADYHFYLRGHHPELAFELVLYAVPKSRLLQ
ncbi:TPA: FkbM family methyltransferase [Enterobacter roggenkampii]|uniref:FkbM family methyltransferase n=1 Tax=Enterobacter roggenkampii TaxID=1812935 RepID=UPI00190DEB29|nr:FkbM family methyltransferase [Enterobacter roggenkampii]MBK4123075.1 FkbM family methyltransferase [Enterobacter roggenkampii]WEY52066.1 FkbM family methyltransferase [Enterobacter roggenkampii]